MPIDPLYADSTSGYLNGQNQVNVPEPPTPGPSTSLTSIARAVGRGLGQGGASLVGAGSDLVSGLAESGTVGVLQQASAMNPDLIEAADKAVNDNIAKARSGNLFQSRLGTAAYNFSDTLKPDPTNTTAIDQVVQGAVSGLTQIGGAAILGGPAAGAIVGGTSIGMGRAEDLKRQGVDVITRSEAGTVEGALGGLGAVMPVGGSTLARTAALVAVGGPGMAVTQGAAEKAILKNANYDHLADQIDPLDPVNLAASTLVAGAFGGAHLVGAKRAASAADTTAKPATPAVPNVPITDMSVDARKALPYNSPALDAYATQAAQAAGVPPEMLLFIKNRGERSNSNQVSSAGAKGVMQFTDDTYKAFGKGDPKDPVNSIDAAAAYSADLLKRYNGDMRAAITEYNGGIKQADAVHAGGAPTDPETIAYLRRFDEYAANHQISNAKFNPTPVQTDAALMANGQRIVDDASLTPTDDVASMTSHQDAFETAAKQMDAGEPVDVTSAFSPEALDASVLNRYGRDISDAHAAEAPVEQAQNPEFSAATSSVAGFKTAKGSEYIVHEDGTTTRNKAARDDAGHEGDSGMKPQTDKTIYVDEDASRLSAAGLNGLGEKGARVIMKDGKATLLTWNDKQGKWGYSPSGRDIPFHAEPAVGRHPLELWTPANDVPGYEAYRGMHAGNKITEMTPREATDKLSSHEAVSDASSTQAVSPVEQNVRQAALERPDTVVHLDANAGPQEGKISDILRTIDDEHQASLEDSNLLSVAANCFIQYGDN